MAQCAGKTHDAHRRHFHYHPHITPPTSLVEGAACQPTGRLRFSSVSNIRDAANSPNIGPSVTARVDLVPSQRATELRWVAGFLGEGRHPYMGSKQYSVHDKWQEGFPSLSLDGISYAPHPGVTWNTVDGIRDTLQENGWKDAGDPFRCAAYTRHGNVCTMSGTIVTTKVQAAGNGQEVATLPEECRPAATLVFNVAASPKPFGRTLQEALIMLVMMLAV